jgi:hypothetical protein
MLLSVSGTLNIGPESRKPEVLSLAEKSRTLSHLVHPPLLDEAGLGSAIWWYVEGFE